MNTPTQGNRRSDDRAEDAAIVIGDGDKLINVVLLNGERLNVRVLSTATGQDLYNTISDHLGLSETIFFGLMIIKDGEHEFLDLNEKLSKLAKYAPHLWKDDVSCNSSLVFTIFFRVKYYVENICLLQQQSTRHLYYLQLRKDVLEGGIFVHEETAMLLASYALQAEVGDYNQSVHGNDYFVPEHYLPQRAIAKLTASYIRNTLPQLHKAHTGISDAQAEIEYLKEAQKLQEYGIIFNKVSKFKKDKRGSYSLGISVRGLIVYEERGIVKSPVFRHPWQNIKRMAFHRRRFFIEAHGPPETSKIVLYTISYKKSRYLLKMCTSFYKFQMMMGIKLSSLREFPKDGSVKMNGVVRTDMSDSPGRGSPVSDVGKAPSVDHSVIQPSGVGPAIHLNGSATPVQENQPVQVSIYPVQLQKINGSLGLNIIGGIELGGIYVKTMAHDGSAALSGKINIGDRILEINGQSLEGISRQDAVNLLRTAPQVCVLLIESCVATPATPNGKPAVPGNYSTTAFHQPNRSQPQASFPPEHQYPDPNSSPQHQYYPPVYNEQTQMGSVDQYSEDSSVGQYWGEHQYQPQEAFLSNTPLSDEGWRSAEESRYRNLPSGSGRESDMILESGYQSQVQIPSVVHDTSVAPDRAEHDHKGRRGDLLEMKLYRYEEHRKSESYSVDSSFFSSMVEEQEAYEDGRYHEEFIPQGRRSRGSFRGVSPSTRSDHEDDLRELYNRDEPGLVTRFFNYLGFEGEQPQSPPQPQPYYPGDDNQVTNNNFEYIYDQVNQLTENINTSEKRSVEMKVFKRTESEDDRGYPIGPRITPSDEADDQLRYDYSRTLQTGPMPYDSHHKHRANRNQSPGRGLSMDTQGDSFEEDDIGMFGERIERSKGKGFSWFDRDSYRSSSSSPEKETKSRLTGFFSSGESRRQESVGDNLPSTDNAGSAQSTRAPRAASEPPERLPNARSPGVFAKTKSSWWSSSVDDKATMFGGFFSSSQSSASKQSSQIPQQSRKEEAVTIQHPPYDREQETRPTFDETSRRSDNVSREPLSNIQSNDSGDKILRVDELHAPALSSGVRNRSPYASTTTIGSTAVERELAALSQTDVSIIGRSNSRGIRSMTASPTFEKALTYSPSSTIVNVEPKIEPQRDEKSHEVKRQAAKKTQEDQGKMFSGFFTPSQSSKRTSPGMTKAASEPEPKSSTKQQTMRKENSSTQPDTVERDTAKKQEKVPANAANQSSVDETGTSSFPKLSSSFSWFSSKAAEQTAPLVTNKEQGIFGGLFSSSQTPQGTSAQPKPSQQPNSTSEPRPQQPSQPKSSAQASYKEPPKPTLAGEKMSPQPQLTMTAPKSKQQSQSIATEQLNSQRTSQPTLSQPRSQHPPKAMAPEQTLFSQPSTPLDHKEEVPRTTESSRGSGRTSFPRNQQNVASPFVQSESVDENVSRKKSVPKPTVAEEPSKPDEGMFSKMMFSFKGVFTRPEAEPARQEIKKEDPRKPEAKPTEKAERTQTRRTINGRNDRESSLRGQTKNRQPQQTIAEPQETKLSQYMIRRNKLAEKYGRRWLRKTRDSRNGIKKSNVPFFQDVAEAAFEQRLRASNSSINDDERSIGSANPLVTFDDEVRRLRMKMKNISDEIGDVPFDHASNVRINGQSVEDDSERFVRSLERKRNKIDNTWDDIMKDIDQHPERRKESISNVRYDSKTRETPRNFTSRENMNCFGENVFENGVDHVEAVSLMEEPDSPEALQAMASLKESVTQVVMDVSQINTETGNLQSGKPEDKRPSRSPYKDNERQVQQEPAQVTQNDSPRTAQRRLINKNIRESKREPSDPLFGRLFSEPDSEEEDDGLLSKLVFGVKEVFALDSEDDASTKSQNSPQHAARQARIKAEEEALSDMISQFRDKYRKGSSGSESFKPSLSPASTSLSQVDGSQLSITDADITRSDEPPPIKRNETYPKAFSTEYSQMKPFSNSLNPIPGKPTSPQLVKEQNSTRQESSNKATVTTSTKTDSLLSSSFEFGASKIEPKPPPSESAKPKLINHNIKPEKDHVDPIFGKLLSQPTSDDEDDRLLNKLVFGIKEVFTLEDDPAFQKEKTPPPMSPSMKAKAEEQEQAFADSVSQFKARYAKPKEPPLTPDLETTDNKKDTPSVTGVPEQVKLQPQVENTEVRRHREPAPSAQFSKDDMEQKKSKDINTLVHPEMKQEKMSVSSARVTKSITQTNNSVKETVPKTIVENEKQQEGFFTKFFIRSEYHTESEKNVPGQTKAKDISPNAKDGTKTTGKEHYKTVPSQVSNEVKRSDEKPTLSAPRAYSSFKPGSMEAVPKRTEESVKHEEGFFSKLFTRDDHTVPERKVFEGMTAATTKYKVDSSSDNVKGKELKKEEQNTEKYSWKQVTPLAASDTMKGKEPKKERQEAEKDIGELVEHQQTSLPNVTKNRPEASPPKTDPKKPEEGRFSRFLSSILAEPPKDLVDDKKPSDEQKPKAEPSKQRQGNVTANVAKITKAQDQPKGETRSAQKPIDSSGITLTQRKQTDEKKVISLSISDEMKGKEPKREKQKPEKDGAKQAPLPNITKNSPEAIPPQNEPKKPEEGRFSRFLSSMLAEPPKDVIDDKKPSDVQKPEASPSTQRQGNVAGNEAKVEDQPKGKTRSAQKPIDATAATKSQRNQTEENKATSTLPKEQKEQVRNWETEITKRQQVTVPANDKKMPSDQHLAHKQEKKEDVQSEPLSIKDPNKAKVSNSPSIPLEALAEHEMEPMQEEDDTLSKLIFKFRAFSGQPQPPKSEHLNAKKHSNVQSTQEKEKAGKQPAIAGQQSREVSASGKEDIPETGTATGVPKERSAPTKETVKPKEEEKAEEKGIFSKLVFRMGGARAKELELERQRHARAKENWKKAVRVATKARRKQEVEKTREIIKQLEKKKSQEEGRLSKLMFRIMGSDSKHTKSTKDEKSKTVPEKQVQAQTKRMETEVKPTKSELENNNEKHMNDLHDESAFSKLVFKLRAGSHSESKPPTTAESTMTKKHDQRPQTNVENEPPVEEKEKPELKSEVKNIPASDKQPKEEGGLFRFVSKFTEHSNEASEAVKPSEQQRKAPSAHEKPELVGQPSEPGKGKQKAGLAREDATFKSSSQPKPQPTAQQTILKNTKPRETLNRQGSNPVRPDSLPVTPTSSFPKEEPKGGLFSKFVSRLVEEAPRGETNATQKASTNIQKDTNLPPAMKESKIDTRQAVEESELSLAEQHRRARAAAKTEVRANNRTEQEENPEKAVEVEKLPGPQMIGQNTTYESEGGLFSKLGLRHPTEPPGKQKIIRQVSKSESEAGPKTGTGNESRADSQQNPTKKVTVASVTAPKQQKMPEEGRFAKLMTNMLAQPTQNADNSKKPPQEKTQERLNSKADTKKGLKEEIKTTPIVSSSGQAKKNERKVLPKDKPTNDTLAEKKVSKPEDTVEKKSEEGRFSRFISSMLSEPDPAHPGKDKEQDKKDDSTQVLPARMVVQDEKKEAKKTAENTWKKNVSNPKTIPEGEHKPEEQTKPEDGAFSRFLSGMLVEPAKGSGYDKKSSVQQINAKKSMPRDDRVEKPALKTSVQESKEPSGVSKPEVSTVPPHPKTQSTRLASTQQSKERENSGKAAISTTQAMPKDSQTSNTRGKNEREVTRVPVATRPEQGVKTPNDPKGNNEVKKEKQSEGRFSMFLSSMLAETPKDENSGIQTSKPREVKTTSKTSVLEERDPVDNSKRETPNITRQDAKPKNQQREESKPETGRFSKFLSSMLAEPVAEEPKKEEQSKLSIRSQSQTDGKVEEASKADDHQEKVKKMAEHKDAKVYHPAKAKPSIPSDDKKAQTDTMQEEGLFSKLVFRMTDSQSNEKPKTREHNIVSRSREEDHRNLSIEKSATLSKTPSLSEKATDMKVKEKPQSKQASEGKLSKFVFGLISDSQQEPEKTKVAEGAVPKKSKLQPSQQKLPDNSKCEYKATPKEKQYSSQDDIQIGKPKGLSKFASPDVTETPASSELLVNERLTSQVTSRRTYKISQPKASGDNYLSHLVSKIGKEPVKDLRSNENTVFKQETTSSSSRKDTEHPVEPNRAPQAEEDEEVGLFSKLIFQSKVEQSSPEQAASRFQSSKNKDYSRQQSRKDETFGTSEKPDISHVVMSGAFGRHGVFVPKDNRADQKTRKPRSQSQSEAESVLSRIVSKVKENLEQGSIQKKSPAWQKVRTAIDKGNFRNSAEREAEYHDQQFPKKSYKAECRARTVGWKKVRRAIDQGKFQEFIRSEQNRAIKIAEFMARRRQPSSTCVARSIGWRKVRCAIDQGKFRKYIRSEQTRAIKIAQFMARRSHRRPVCQARSVGWKKVRRAIDQGKFREYIRWEQIRQRRIAEFIAKRSCRPPICNARSVGWRKVRHAIDQGKFREYIRSEETRMIKIAEFMARRCHRRPVCNARSVGWRKVRRAIDQGKFREYMRSEQIRQRRIAEFMFRRSHRRTVCRARSIGWIKVRRAISQGKFREYIKSEQTQAIKMAKFVARRSNRRPVCKARSVGWRKVRRAIDQGNFREYMRSEHIRQRRIAEFMSKRSQPSSKCLARSVGWRKVRRAIDHGKFREYKRLEQIRQRRIAEFTFKRSHRRLVCGARSVGWIKLRRAINQGKFREYIRSEEIRIIKMAEFMARGSHRRPVCNARSVGWRKVRRAIDQGKFREYMRSEQIRQRRIAEFIAKRSCRPPICNARSVGWRKVRHAIDQGKFREYIRSEETRMIKIAEFMARRCHRRPVCNARSVGWRKVRCAIDQGKFREYMRSEQIRQRRIAEFMSKRSQPSSKCLARSVGWRKVRRAIDQGKFREYIRSEQIRQRRIAEFTFKRSHRRLVCGARSVGWIKVRRAINQGKFRKYIRSEEIRMIKMAEFMARRSHRRPVCNARSVGWKKVRRAIDQGKFREYMRSEQIRQRRIAEFVFRRSHRRTVCRARSIGWIKVRRAINQGKFREYIRSEEIRMIKIAEFMARRSHRRPVCNARSVGWRKVRRAIDQGKFREYMRSEQIRQRRIAEFMFRGIHRRTVCRARSIGWIKVRRAISQGKFRKYIRSEEIRMIKMAEFMARRSHRRPVCNARSVGWKKVRRAIDQGKFREYMRSEQIRQRRIAEFVFRRSHRRTVCRARSIRWIKVRRAINQGKFREYIRSEEIRMIKIAEFMARRSHRRPVCNARSVGWRKVRRAIDQGKFREYMRSEQMRQRRIAEFMFRGIHRRTVCRARSIGWIKVRRAISQGKFREYIRSEEIRMIKMAEFMARRSHRRPVCNARSVGWKKIRRAIDYGKFREYMRSEQIRQRRIAEFMFRRSHRRTVCRARSIGWIKVRRAISQGKFREYIRWEEIRMIKIAEFMARRSHRRQFCNARSVGWIKVRRAIDHGKFREYMRSEQIRQRRIAEFMFRRSHRRTGCRARSIGWIKVRRAISQGKFREYIRWEEIRMIKIAEFMARRSHRRPVCNARSVGWRKVRRAIDQGKFREYMRSEQIRQRRIAEFMFRRSHRRTVCRARAIGWIKVRRAINQGKFREYIKSKQTRAIKIAEFMAKGSHRRTVCRARSIGWIKVRRAIIQGKFREYIQSEQTRAIKIAKFTAKGSHRRPVCKAVSVGWRNVRRAIDQGKFREYIPLEQIQSKKIAEFMTRRSQRSIACRARSVGWRKVRRAIDQGKFREYIRSEEIRMIKIAEFIARRIHLRPVSKARSVGWRKVRRAIDQGKFREYIRSEQISALRTAECMARIGNRRPVSQARSVGWRKVRRAINHGKFREYSRAVKAANLMRNGKDWNTVCRSRSAGWRKVHRAIVKGMFREYNRKEKLRTAKISEFIAKKSYKVRSVGWKKVRRAIDEGKFKKYSRSQDSAVKAAEAGEEAENGMFSRFLSKVNEARDAQQSSGSHVSKSKKAEEPSLSSMFGRFKTSFFNSSPDEKQKTVAKPVAKQERNKNSPRGERKKKKPIKTQTTYKTYGSFGTFEIRQDAIDELVSTTEKLVDNIDDMNAKKTRHQKHPKVGSGKRTTLRAYVEENSTPRRLDRRLPGKARFIWAVKKVIIARRITDQREPRQISFAQQQRGKARFVLAVKAVMRLNRAKVLTEKWQGRGKDRFTRAVKTVIRLNRANKLCQKKQRGKERFIRAVKTVIRLNRVNMLGQKKQHGKERFIMAVKTVIRLNRAKKLCQKKQRGKERFIKAVRTVIRLNRAKRLYQKKQHGKERFVKAVRTVIRLNRGRQRIQNIRGKARFIKAVRTVIRINRATEQKLKQQKILNQPGKRRFIRAVKSVIQSNRVTSRTDKRGTQQRRLQRGLDKKPTVRWLDKSSKGVPRWMFESPLEGLSEEVLIAIAKEDAKKAQTMIERRGPYQKAFEAKQKRLQQRGTMMPPKTTKDPPRWVTESPLEGLSEEALFAVVEEDTKKAFAIVDRKGPYQRAFEAKEEERKRIAEKRKQVLQQLIAEEKAVQESPPDVWSVRMARIRQKIKETEIQAPASQRGKLAKQPSVSLGEIGTGKATFQLAAKAVISSEQATKRQQIQPRKVAEVVQVVRSEVKPSETHVPEIEQQAPRQKTSTLSASVVTQVPPGSMKPKANDEEKSQKQLRAKELPDTERSDKEEHSTAAHSRQAPALPARQDSEPDIWSARMNRIGQLSKVSGNKQRAKSSSSAKGIDERRTKEVRGAEKATNSNTVDSAKSGGREVGMDGKGRKTENMKSGPKEEKHSKPEKKIESSPAVADKRESRKEQEQDITANEPRTVSQSSLEQTKTSTLPSNTAKRGSTEETKDRGAERSAAGTSPHSKEETSETVASFIKWGKSWFS
ncbi:uncharacterized protein LOC5501855 isoform X2 [Nematostella vectensis]|uniref:uncharacterized protein LOC5501855 isoform X2 n=1 Tax=Nematostella vectensis TaxID=45351 RepID=UPI0020777478|nr:uncharacterized protein LOC5501855 isoform X2 [Nematostella vectensis]XP_048580513.1 uncharacterized protein LOC5501855 isoform X2 [Nematostella vectensis]XP_048580514.1 uncharacterized protein LOC5501855 isoform X2 [Nematostella vectensis]XP_048580515.1 uncharacterized protein LOC5501855 isoform X2 [Nematostella vectensis]XP_048580516.1 uncharacterized protein LOC5501855 isoform X2 [Nematostella vectensis]